VRAPDAGRAQRMPTLWRLISCSLPRAPMSPAARRIAAHVLTSSCGRLCIAGSGARSLSTQRPRRRQVHRRFVEKQPAVAGLIRALQAGRCRMIDQAAAHRHGRAQRESRSSTSLFEPVVGGTRCASKVRSHHAGGQSPRIGGVPTQKR